MEATVRRPAWTATSASTAIGSGRPAMDGRARVVELDDAVAVLGRFPALAGVDAARRRAARSCCCAGPTAPARRRCCGCAPGCSRSPGARARCSATTWPPSASALRPRVGLLGHRNGLYLDLTVAENVAFWGATVGATRPRSHAALERLGLAGRLADLPVRRLSAGQQRRTALACLVARRAELWLLDEPHAGLDAAGRDELDATLRQAAAAGATVHRRQPRARARRAAGHRGSSTSSAGTRAIGGAA